ncbi:hypothetical protein DPMN_179021 [Dreissena polymorpha]|uniref:Uncharacterized protein n=1 Tax=Dreissena polymorpha TaxID=45954 RepID=A0A9D4IN46_DREPO|nr:hypothetical protein DPMN_179021 [Dreissena polymorpha]
MVFCLPVTPRPNSGRRTRYPQAQQLEANTLPPGPTVGSEHVTPRPNSGKRTRYPQAQQWEANPLPPSNYAYSRLSSPRRLIAVLCDNRSITLYRS